MSYASGAAGEELLFKFGDGGAPETYAASCSINTDRKIDFSSEIWQGTRANCDTPSAPAKTVRRVKSIDVKFTGSGVTDAASFLVLLALWEAGLPFNGKAIQDLDASGWTLTGSWVIESLSTGGMRGEDQAFDISLAQADTLVRS